MKILNQTIVIVKGLNVEEILKAYEDLLKKFIKVYTLNKYLKDKICDLVSENKWLETSVTKYETLLKEKGDKVLEIATKLDNTKKNLRMLIKFLAWDNQ